MKRWLGGALLSLTACLGPGEGGAEPGGSEEGRRIGLRREDGRILLPVVLPGGQPSWFLFDTGSGDYSVADAQLTQGLGLQHEVARAGSVMGARAVFPTLEVGEDGRRDHRLFVEDFSTLAHLQGLSATGVLGTEWFRGLELELWLSSDEFCTHPTRERPGGPGSIELRWEPGGALTGIVDVGGRACRAFFDTGARSSLIHLPVADAVGEVRPALDAEETPTLRDVELRIGGLPCTLPRLAVTASPQDTLGAELVLGMDVLGNYDLRFDFRERPRLRVAALASDVESAR